MLLLLHLLDGVIGIDCCVLLTEVPFDVASLPVGKGSLLFSPISTPLTDDEFKLVLLLSGLVSLSRLSFGLVVEDGSSGLILLLVG